MTLPGPFTMAQQAKDEFYGDVGALIEDLAAAVNEEARDLQAAGADVIQLDEPWVRSDPEAARRYAVAGINRALEGITVPTVVHICFGYAAVVSGQSKPHAYSYLPELADCAAGAISIEAAQPKLDLGVLRDLSGKTVLLGVLDLGRAEAESAGGGRGPHPAGLGVHRAGPADPGARLRHEIPSARPGLRQAQGVGRRALRSCGANWQGPGQLKYRCPPARRSRRLQRNEHRSKLVPWEQASAERRAILTIGGFRVHRATF